MAHFLVQYKILCLNYKIVFLWAEGLIGSSSDAFKIQFFKIQFYICNWYVTWMCQIQNVEVRAELQFGLI